jgi:hypothetical protein
MAQAIAKAAKVSVETLYDNKQLWHPEFTESRNSTNTNNSAPSASEIASLQAELERLERDRQTYSSP